jgi:hypothetical protein
MIRFPFAGAQVSRHHELLGEAEPAQGSMLRR